MDGVGPPSADAAGPPAGLPFTGRKSGNRRQPERVAQLRSESGPGPWKLVPEPLDSGQTPPLPAHSEPRLQTEPSLDSRPSGPGADLVPNGSGTQTPNQSPSPVLPDSGPPPTQRGL